MSDLSQSINIPEWIYRSAKISDMWEFSGGEVIIEETNHHTFEIKAMKKGVNYKDGSPRYYGISETFSITNKPINGHYLVSFHYSTLCGKVEYNSIVLDVQHSLEDARKSAILHATEYAKPYIERLHANLRIPPIKQDFNTSNS